MLFFPTFFRFFYRGLGPLTISTTTTTAAANLLLVLLYVLLYVLLLQLHYCLLDFGVKLKSTLPGGVLFVKCVPCIVFSSPSPYLSTFKEIKEIVFLVLSVLFLHLAK